jgi:hypothetical protein
MHRILLFQSSLLKATPLLFAHGFLSVIEVILMAALYGGEVLRTRKFFRIA